MNKYQIIYNATNKHITEMITLDKTFFSSYDVGTLEKCREWLSANKDIYTILLCNEKVIGYINFIPISNDFYQDFKHEIKKDFDLSKNDIMSFSPTNITNCLFTSIVIDKQHQNALVLKLLWEGFIKKLQTLKPSIGNIIMDCISPIGEKCAIKYLNAKFIKKSEHGKIYEGTLNYKELSL